MFLVCDLLRLGPRQFAKYVTGVYIACAYILRGVREPFRPHACIYTNGARARIGSAPSVRARADAWVRATRERCAGRLFRYCCYCWGNNRPSIGRLGTMYLFRCGQRCSIDQDPPFASLGKSSAWPTKIVVKCASREFLFKVLLSLKF